MLGRGGRCDKLGIFSLKLFQLAVQGIVLEILQLGGVLIVV